MEGRGCQQDWAEGGQSCGVDVRMTGWNRGSFETREALRHCPELDFYGSSHRVQAAA